MSMALVCGLSQSLSSVLQQVVAESLENGRNVTIAEKGSHASPGLGPCGALGVEVSLAHLLVIS